MDSVRSLKKIVSQKLFGNKLSETWEGACFADIMMDATKKGTEKMRDLRSPSDGKAEQSFSDDISIEIERCEQPEQPQKSFEVGSCSVDADRKTREIMERKERMGYLRQSSDGNATSNRISSSSTQASNQHQNYMSIELYQACSSDDDEDSFIDAISIALAGEKQTFDDVFQSITPLGNTMLHVAVINNNINIMEIITDSYPSIITRKNAHGDTALHLAAKAGCESVIKRLVYQFRKYGESIKSPSLLRLQNYKGYTPLHEALINNEGSCRQYSIVHDLIKGDPEVSFSLNEDGESPFYLAAKAGFRDVVDRMFKCCTYIKISHDDCLKGKPAFHAAIFHAATTRNKTDYLDHMLEVEPRLIYSRDEKKRTPLHYASSIGYLSGVDYLLSKNASAAFEKDEDGLRPIHLACSEGNLDVVKKLLGHCPSFSGEILDDNGQSIVHFAAMTGNVKVVRYILTIPELENVINQRDKDGNTPLHLATMKWHPKVVSDLVWDKRVDLKAINNVGYTPLDAALVYMDAVPSFRERLTWAALKSAGAPSSNICYKEEGQEPSQINMEKYRDRVNTLLLVSTLIVTVTFAAGFTLPGGYNSSDSTNKGMATLLGRNKFYIFIFCDMIALYSSLIVAVTLIWAQLGDIKLVLNALRLAIPLLGVSLLTMSLAFMSGVCLVVSELGWLANAVLIIGSVFLVALALLFFPLCLLSVSSNRCLRLMSYYIFCLLLRITGNQIDDHSKG